MTDLSGRVRFEVLTRIPGTAVNIYSSVQKVWKLSKIWLLDLQDRNSEIFVE